MIDQHQPYDDGNHPVGDGDARQLIPFRPTERHVAPAPRPATPNRVKRSTRSGPRWRVSATLPACLTCGAKDQAKVSGGTHRPYGDVNPAKLQYVTCQCCGERYEIEWG